jgi:phospholipid transport system substrate-binding protein
MVMKRDVVLSSVLFLIQIFLSHQVIAQNESAGDIVKSTTTQVVERIRAERDRINSDPEYIYIVMDQLVVPHFDFQTMSRAVLGSSWRGATSEQQNAFLNEFKELLIGTYTANLIQYLDNKIVYYQAESRPESRFVLVRTEVQGAVNNNSLPIDYRMHQVDGKWMVVDVAVDKVSLVSTYRGSFRSEINNDGLDSLIAKLAEKNKRHPL